MRVDQHPRQTLEALLGGGRAPRVRGLGGEEAVQQVLEGLLDQPLVSAPQQSHQHVQLTRRRRLPHYDPHRRPLSLGDRGLQHAEQRGARLRADLHVHSLAASEGSPEEEMYRTSTRPTMWCSSSVRL